MAISVENRQFSPKFFNFEARVFNAPPKGFPLELGIDVTSQKRKSDGATR